MVERKVKLLNNDVIEQVIPNRFTAPGPSRC